MFEDASANRFTGMLHRLDPDGGTPRSDTSIGVSNGLAFSPDGRRCTSPTPSADTIWAYDYDAGTGHPSNERVFSDFADLPGRARRRLR